MFSRLVCKRIPQLSTTHRTWTSLSRTPESVIVHFLNTSFPYIWLRDSCQSPTSINHKTGHKLHCTADIPLSIAPIDDPIGVKVTSEGLEIAWNDGGKSVFSKRWLETYSKPEVEEKFHWDDTFRMVPWTRASIEASSTLTGFSYQSILSSDEELLKAYEQLMTYGLLFIRGVPTEETSDDKCELKTLADRIGEMRKTFYGLVWDVVKLKDGNNVAFTDLALRLHMDVLYLEHPPRYQILHCLRNKAIGGTSLAVDGIYAAQRLRKTHPEAFQVLTKTPVTFHYIHNGHHIHQDRPTIALAPPSPLSSHREISHINYSPPEQGPLPLSTPKEFYPALKQLTDLFKDEEHIFKYDLAEGDAVIFDNRRLVHGRTAFRYMTDEERRKTGRGVDDGQPDRWLKGCYLGADAVLDRVRVLKTRYAAGKPNLEYVDY